jgi:DNA-binding winged helix-turn-helix (wHTH) protein/TolB-like protein/Tfp pilus assembly protein PilF
VLVTDPAGPRPDVLAFGEFVLDAARATCMLAGVAVPLRPKAFALLLHLARNPDRVLSKTELLANVWPGVVVGDDSLSQCINELRAALGERGPALIRTVARRGYRFDAVVESGVPPPADPMRPVESAKRAAGWSRWAAACGAALLLLLVGAPGVGELYAPAGIDVELANRRSLAVMPFADLGEPATPYLAEGITLEILTDLARLPDALIVTGGAPTPGARTIAADVRRYGRDLGVRHVLFGSARRDGERIQVIAQMARTDDGALLWSERFDYDRPADWNWVRDVSRRVAATLDVKLGEAAFDSVRRDARNGTAIDEWMRATYLKRRVRSRDDLLEARRHFEAAVAADPQSVNALAGLACTHLDEVVYRWSPSRTESFAAARELALRAIALDPNHAVALSILGDVAAFSSDFDTALDYIRRALQRNPNDYHVQRDISAVMYWSVRLDEVAPYAEMALRLGPMDPDNVAKAYSILGYTQLIQGHDEDAYRSLRLSVQASSMLPGPRSGLIAAAALTGRMDEAHRRVAELMRDRPDMTIAGLRRAGFIRTEAFRAAHARYLEGLRLAGLPEGAPALAAGSVPEPNRK